VVGVAYPLGLTLLLPLPLLLLLPPDAVVGPAGSAPLIGGVATALVVASLLASLVYTHSLAGSLKTLGRLSFVPGLIGVVFWVVGREAVLGYAARVVPGFREVERAAQLYVDRAVPSVRWLTLAFFAVGVLLLLLGDRLAHWGSRRPR
jgi:type IV secretory pathway TrbD component